MKTYPFQSGAGRTLLYKPVICDRLIDLICSLLRPEFGVGGGPGKPADPKMVQSYQTEKGWLLSSKSTQFDN